MKFSRNRLKAIRTKKPVAKYSDSEPVPLNEDAFSPAFTNVRIDWHL